MRRGLEITRIDGFEGGEMVEDARELGSETVDVGLGELDAGEARDVQDIVVSEGHGERLQDVSLYRRVWPVGAQLLRSGLGLI